MAERTDYGGSLEMLTEVYLRQEYYGKRRSLNQIGAEHGVSPAAVAYWMDKYGLKRRSVSEGVYCRWNPEECFQIREPSSEAERLLKAVGLVIHWCEGLQKTDSTVAITNTNLNMLKLWKAFLLDIFGVNPSKLRVHLYVHQNQDGEANVKLLNLMRQWHKELIEGLNGGLRLTGKASVLKTDAR